MEAEFEETHAPDEDAVEQAVVQLGAGRDLHALAEDPAVGHGPDEVLAVGKVAAVDADADALVPVVDHGRHEAAHVGGGLPLGDGAG